jgi:hypothetical protein
MVESISHFNIIDIHFFLTNELRKILFLSFLSLFLLFFLWRGIIIKYIHVQLDRSFYYSKSKTINVWSEGKEEKERNKDVCINVEFSVLHHSFMITEHIRRVRC